MAIARWIILTGLALLTVGCGKRAVNEHASSSVELLYWPAPNPQEVQLADTLVRRWNRLHPDIHVRMQSIPVSQSTEEVLLAAIAGGTTPDICSNIQPGALYDYVRAKGLVPLNSFPGFDTLAKERGDSSLLASFTSSDGNLYQLPWKSNPVMMFYNKRLLQEAGVTEVPATYSEYITAGRKVTRDLDGDGQIDVWMGERDIRPIWWQRLFDFFPFYIGASGGKTLFASGTFAPDDQAAMRVFEFFHRCYANRIFPRTFFQGGDPFLLEKKATHFSGPWEVASVRKFAPGLDYGIAPIPVPDGTSGPVYTHGDFKNIAIFSTTRHPEAAWEFVQYLLRPEHDLLLLELCDQIPVRRDLLTNPLFTAYFDRNPMMVAFARQATRARGIDAAPDLKEIFDTLSQIYESCALYGAISPAEAVRQLRERTMLIMEWNR
jgi:multiple sugar transport system substrate-binding protein